MPENRKRTPGITGNLQFLTGRKKMLNDYDVARDHSAGHEVETHHGIVAQAQFRHWLAEFLPKRFGVCSGYVVSQKLGVPASVPHFDIIIYDQLRAPTLWLEDHADSSSAGASRAIPAEYVHGVLEVKAALNSTTAASAVEHLGDLRPLLAGIDGPDERYPAFLPESFFSMVVAFDLRKDDEYSIALLDNLIPEEELRGLVGAYVLRGEGLDKASALIHLTHGDAVPSTVGRGRVSILTPGGAILGNCKKASDGAAVGTIVSWSDANFARFAFDVLALLDGTYRGNRLSSFHGLEIFVP